MANIENEDDTITQIIAKYDNYYEQRNTLLTREEQVSYKKRELTQTYQLDKPRTIMKLKTLREMYTDTYNTYFYQHHITDQYDFYEWTETQMYQFYDGIRKSIEITNDIILDKTEEEQDDIIQFYITKRVNFEQARHKMKILYKRIKPCMPQTHHLKEIYECQLLDKTTNSTTMKKTTNNNGNIKQYKKRRR